MRNSLFKTSSAKKPGDRFQTDKDLAGCLPGQRAVLRQSGYLIIILFYLFIFCPCAAAGDGSAQQASLSAWLIDHALYDAQVLTLANIQQPSMAADNPENRLKDIERYSAELHVRPNIYLDAGQLRLGASPRLTVTHRQFRDGIASGKEKTDTDIFLREGYLKWRPLSYITLGLERKNMQWGSGFLTSPSNPFYQDTGKTRAYHELGGKDFVSINYVPNDRIALLALANFGKGEAEDREAFHRAYALKAELTFSDVFLSPVISYKEDDRLSAGGYATWTASNALLLFFDTAFARGGKGLYVKSVADDPFGGELLELRHDSDKIQTQFLAGGSYTFESGATVSVEYLYYGPGYNNNEAQEYYKLLHRSSDAAIYSGEDPVLTQLAGLGMRNLGQAALNHLSFQRRNYMLAYLNRNDWMDDRLDVTVGRMQNLDDRSFYFFASGEADLTGTLHIFINLIDYSNRADEEFNADLDYSYTVGVKLFF